MAERQFTARELQRYNGERGERVYVAYAGVVYDVTECPKWRTGFHEQLHFAGFDLTSELPDAPHGAVVLNRPGVRRMGVLQS
jgi:predicted heme/steroid binding protein